MDGRKRTVQIKFRVTEAERDLILEKMKLVPTRNMAAYLRKIAIDGYIIQIDHADIKAMTAEIQKIGVNVNQIARQLSPSAHSRAISCRRCCLCRSSSVSSLNAFAMEPPFLTLHGTRRGHVLPPGSPPRRHRYGNSGDYAPPPAFCTWRYTLSQF